MASYQQRRVQYEVQYSGGGGQPWSDGHGFQKSGPYGNVSGFSCGDSFEGGSHGSGSYGGGSYGYSSGGASATGYGHDGGYDNYGSGGGLMSSGGGHTQLYKQEMQPMVARPGYSQGHGSGMFHSSEGHGGGSSGDPFGALVPSSFAPGTDPKFIDCFNRIDKDRSGFICDQELQSALSTFDQRFCLRTVHLLMYLFTGSNAKVVGPKEFVPLVRSLQTWKATFQKYDRDRNGRLDDRELREALMSMGFNVSPFVLRLLMSKYDKSGAKCAIEYDYFIECCVVVKGLTEKFRAKEDGYCGAANFTYDEFLLSVLPFIVA